MLHRNLHIEKSQLTVLCIDTRLVEMVKNMVKFSLVEQKIAFPLINPSN